MIRALVGGVRCMVSAPALGRPRGAPLTTDQLAASQCDQSALHVRAAEPRSVRRFLFSCLTGLIGGGARRRGAYKTLSVIPGFCVTAAGVHVTQRVRRSTPVDNAHRDASLPVGKGSER